MSDKASDFYTYYLARRWAFEQLDLPNETPAAEARPRLLKQLADMDFMPPGNWNDALRVCGVLPSQNTEGGSVHAIELRAAENLLREDVDVFAAFFFSLLTEVRISQIQQLLQRCAGVPALISRLERLRDAVDLPSELPLGESAEVVELLDQVRRLFAMAARERACHRWRFINRCRADLARWRDAARAIEQNYASHAALEPMLIRELAGSPTRAQVRRRLVRRRQWRLRRLRAFDWLFGSEQKRFAWIVACCLTFSLTFGFTLAYFKEIGNAPHRTQAPQFPSRESELKKTIDDLNRSVNESLRQGKPIPEVLRRLYGLPKTETPSKPSIVPEADGEGRSEQELGQVRRPARGMTKGLNEVREKIANP